MYLKFAFSLILSLLLLFIYWIASIFLVIAFGKVDLDGKPPVWASVTLIVFLIIAWVIVIRLIFQNRNEHKNTR